MVALLQACQLFQDGVDDDGISPEQQRIGIEQSRRSGNSDLRLRKTYHRVERFLIPCGDGGPRRFLSTINVLDLRSLLQK